MVATSNSVFSSFIFGLSSHRDFGCDTHQSPLPFIAPSKILSNHKCHMSLNDLKNIFY